MTFHIKNYIKTSQQHFYNFSYKQIAIRTILERLCCKFTRGRGTEKEPNYLRLF